RELRGKLGVGRHRHDVAQPAAVDHDHRRHPHRTGRDQNRSPPLPGHARTDHPPLPETPSPPAHPMALAGPVATSAGQHPGPPTADLNDEGHRRHHPEPGDENRTPTSPTPRSHTPRPL